MTSDLQSAENVPVLWLAAGGLIRHWPDQRPGLITGQRTGDRERDILIGMWHGDGDTFYHATVPGIKH